jgi:hypothetical protein
MNQASLKLATMLEGRVQVQGEGLSVLVGRLDFLAMFKGENLSSHKELWTAEFIKQYMMNGDDLRAQIQEWPDQAQQAMFLAAYDAVKTAFRNVTYSESDLSELSNAILNMEKDAGILMAREAKAISAEANADKVVAKKQEFEMRFGMTLNEYKQMSATPLGLKLVNLFTQPEAVKHNPIQAANGAGIRLAAMGVAMGALAAGAAVVAGPVAGVSLAAVGVGLAVSAGMIFVQRQAIAWKVNPTASVMSRLNQGAFSEVVTQGLIQKDEFKLAVAGLRVPGTLQVVSEEHRNRAVRLAMNFLADYLTHSTDDFKIKMVRTQEVVGVLQALQFNVSAEDKSVSSQLKIQLTPTAQPPRALLQDNKFRQLVERLNRLGVNLSIPTQWQPEKPMKLKTSDSAA